MHNCAKCGNTADWNVADLAEFLCIDCEAAFGAWTVMMDMTHMSYTYDEFLKAA